MTLTKVHMRLIVALITAVLFAGVLCALVFIEIPQGNKEVLIALAGSLGGAFVTMIAYYFGDAEGKGQ